MDTESAIELITHRAGQEVCARLFDSIGADEALVVSGSLIEGLGNRRSDLDFFVLSDGHPLDVPVRMAFAGNSWVDVEYLRPSALRELAQKLGVVNPKNLAQVIPLTHKELDRYYRIAIGVTVRGSHTFDQVMSLEVFRSLLKPWAIVHAGAFAARAAIALANDDVTSAVLYANCAAHLGVEGVLTDAGELYPSLKYTHEKAIRAYGAGSAEERHVAGLLHLAGDPRRYVTEVNEYVDAALAACPSEPDSAADFAKPVSPLAYNAQPPAPTLLTRRAAYYVLPEDAATVGALLALPGHDDQNDCGSSAVSVWQAQAHRLVLREALAGLGILMREEADDGR